MRSRPEKPVCRDYVVFLKEHLGKDCLAPLTGQDARALHAFLHAVQLWGNSDTDGRRHAEMAMRALVLAMQEKTRFLAKRAIPRVLDWSHEADIWGRLFPESAGGCASRHCAVPAPSRMTNTLVVEIDEVGEGFVWLMFFGRRIQIRAASREIECAAARFLYREALVTVARDAEGKASVVEVRAK